VRTAAPVTLLMAAVLLPGAAAAQSTNDLLFGAFRLGMKLLGSKPQPSAPETAQPTDAQRKALEAQIDEALKNEPEEERARKKAALLAEFDRSVARANNMARTVHAMEVEQAAQPAVTAEDVLGVVAGGTPGQAMRRAEAMAKDPSAQEKARRTIEAAGAASATTPKPDPR
jgi:hypothetical protein